MIWQSFVRSWLAGKAAEQVAQSAARRRVAGGADPSATAGQPAAADVGLVFALRAESGGLEDMLSGVLATRANDLVFRQGSLEGRSVVLVDGGVGASAAAEAAQRMIVGHRPAWLISTGFSGGCDPALRRGDTLVASELIRLDGARLPLDPAPAAAALQGSGGMQVGPFLMTDRIVCRPDEKKGLGKLHGAIALDMESFAVAEVCREQRVACLAVRIVLDAADDELPADLDPLARQTSTAGRLGAAAGAIFRRPGSIKDMLQLKEHALVASDLLARRLAALIVRLVPPREA